jgi:hypothetical protein
MAGLDIIRTELVTKIDVKEGSVRILLDLPSNHQFAAAIKEDIIEKIESLWDVNEVKVVFTE